MKEDTRHYFVDVDKLADVWSYDPVLSITSSFILRAVDRVPEDKDHKEEEGLTSPHCGLGWYFRFLYATRGLGAAGGIVIRLHPHFIFGSNFGDPHNIKIRIVCPQVENARQPGFKAQNVAFSEALTNIVSYWRPWAEDGTPVPFIAEYHIYITIYFSKNVSECFPRLAPVQTHSPIGISWLSSAAPSDIQFSVYQTRSGDTLSNPTMITACSGILRGRCDYLDLMLDGTTFQSDAALSETSPASDAWETDSDFDEVETTTSDTDTLADERTLPSDGDGAKLRVIQVKTFAMHTWKVLLNYLYTGKITFRHISSHELSRAPHEWDEPSTETLSCSPKSMYRLADALDLPELRALAFQAIKTDISTRNVVTELFAKFTSMYEEIRQFELKFLLAHHFDELPGLQASLEQMLKDLPADKRALSLDIIKFAL